MWSLILRLAFPSHVRHVRASLAQLQLVRTMLTEALGTGEVLRVESDRAMARAVAYQVLAAEVQLRAALGEDQITK